MPPTMPSADIVFDTLFAYLQKQLEDAGFGSMVSHGLPVPQTMIVARKRM